MNKLLIKGAMIGVVIIIAAIALISLFQNKEEKKQPTTTVAQKEAGQWGKAIQKNCLTCHAVRDDGSIERISDVRKTPEGWEDTISRMEQAWGMQITPEDRAAVVKELSEKNGLAPAEMEKVMYWLTSNGSTMEPKLENELMEKSCISCHAAARPLAQYRTEEEWRKLVDFHIAFNPSIIYQMRTQKWEEEATKIVEYLAKINSFDTKEWKEWKEGKKEYELAGKWRIVGYRPGIGMYSGYAELKRKGEDFYENRTLLMPGGKTETYQGNVRVFNGYSLRSSLGGENKKLRGVFNIQNDGKTIKGRWNQVGDIGQYGDEKYYKSDRTGLLDAWPKALKKGETALVHIIGMNLPKNITKEELHTSSDLRIRKIEKQGDDLWVQIDVSSGAQDGLQTIQWKDERLTIQVYDHIDYMKITPEYGLARLNYSGRQQSVQFEAIGYTVGPDGKQGTSDDVEIGPVKAKWGMKEFLLGTEDDLDVHFVGRVDRDTGVFTPAAGGPNPKREWSTNNAGNVTITATYTDPLTKKQIEAETVLLVTVPDYVSIR
ncbi:quinohemoprotein amine dehydrogenase subunit alpha [Geobacillus thermodenitrificans]|uniref:quinohemoprotein amine dehydrogenase subunit alpha n=1 Tax=Geobacillus thermodenitrificans TaxID=33940 RepID=UPI0034C5E633